MDNRTLSTSRWVQESDLLTFTELISLSPETTELGSKKELKSMPFITYLSGLLTAQMLSDDQLISGVEIRCEEKGRCPSTCHLCRRPGKGSWYPVLLEINRVWSHCTLLSRTMAPKGELPGMAAGTSRYQPSHPALAGLRVHQGGHHQHGEGQHLQLLTIRWTRV